MFTSKRPVLDMLTDLCNLCQVDDVDNVVAGALEGADARAGGEEPVEQRGAEDEEEPRGHRQPKGRDHDCDGLQQP